MSVAFGGIVAFLFRGINILVGFLTLVVTANELGVSGRGTFVLGATVIGVVAAMSGGLTASTAYQVSNRKRDPGTVLVNGSALAGTLGALAVIAGIVAGEVLTGEPRAVAVSVGASAAAVIVTTVMAGVYLGHGALVRYNITLVLPPLLSLAAIVVTTVAFGRETPGAALWAFAAGQWLAVPILLATGALSFMRGMKFEGSLVTAMLRFGVLAGLSSAVSYLNYRADALVVERYEGTRGVGVYSIAVYMGEAVWQFSGSLALATYSRVGSATREEAIALTTRVMRHTLVILGAVCLGLFATADILVRILDPDYASAATALRILLPGVLLYGLAAAFSGYYTYQRGKPWASALVAGTGLVIDISLAFVLVPAYGINGAALASSIAYAAAILGALAILMVASRVSPTAIFCPGRADIEDYRALYRRVRAMAERGRGSTARAP
ncbi:MAG: polysaccharide biosynthesis C-terminal domain-containing protein [Thermoflexaceae bacterium]|nr:polysaccharide biosynthesis C-terminal domain-containing protein [Thermoflexaceae bacterium]